MAAELTIQFLGGAGGIGASSTLLSVGNTTILVDAGCRFDPERPLPDLEPLSGKPLDAILVTHAHSDHTGALPVVHAAFRSVPILGTPPTMDLIAILQRDALKLMDLKEEEIPLYSASDVESMMGVCEWRQVGEPFVIRDVQVTYLPASHILGAAMVFLETPAGNVLFTGDYSVSAQKTVPALKRPALAVDLVVSESTYGNRLHSDRKVAEERLVTRVGRVLAAGGRVLIPAFAIGRAQEVLLILKAAFRKGKLPKVPVFVDGMVRWVCGVYSAHERYASKGLARAIKAEARPFYTGSIQPVKKPDDRKAVLEAGPRVIVASSGMLSGGPSSFYAAELAPHKEDAILITGYQDEESPGRALLRLAEEAGPRRLRLGDQVVDVACGFETYSLSAHADRMQMAAFIESLSPRSVVLVHGDRPAKEAFAEHLAAKDITLAEDGDTLNRKYRARRRRTAPPEAQAGERRLTRDAAEKLVGPSSGQPLRLSALAEAWYGKRVDSAKERRLLAALVDFGLVRPHARDAALVMPLTDSSAAEAERELEAKLKSANPKGRLLEACQRMRLPAPVVRHSKSGTRHYVTMLLAHPDGEVSSGKQKAHSQRLAEQMAAEALLGELEARQPGQGATVGDAEAAELRQENPKGRLLEGIAGWGLGSPVFETEGVVSGWRSRVRLGALETGWYTSPEVKVAEQAAAKALLGLLADAPPAPASDAGGKDARMQLNEMRQRGLIAGFGFELVAREGPPHAPVFKMKGWMALPDGTRHETEVVDARSKKAGERALAARLLGECRQTADHSGG